MDGYSLGIHSGKLVDINLNDVAVAYTVYNPEFATQGYRYGICISAEPTFPEELTRYYYEDAHSEDTVIQIPDLTVGTTYYYSAVIDIDGTKIAGDTLEYTHHYYDDAVFMGSYSDNGKPQFVAKGNLIMRSDGTAYIAPSGDYILDCHYSEGADEWDRFQWGDVTGERTEQGDPVKFYLDTWDIGGRINEDIVRNKLGGAWRIPKNGYRGIPGMECEVTYGYRSETWTNKISGKSVTFRFSGGDVQYWTSTGFRERTGSIPNYIWHLYTKQH